MKQLSLVTIFLAVVVGFLMVTGFQCGSAEVTSAKLYIQRQDWPGALTALEKEVQKNPNNPEAWYLLGQTRLKLGEIAAEQGKYDSMNYYFTGMKDAYNKSLGVGKDFEPKIQTEELYAWQKSINAGVNLFNKSVNASKDSAAMLREKSLYAYDAAILIRPDSILAYKNAAIAAQANGNMDMQMSYLKKARERKADPDLNAQIIQYYLDKGDEAKTKGDTTAANQHYSTAVMELSEARKLDPNNPVLVDAMINTYIKLDRTDEAIPLMEEGLKQDPNNKVYHYNLGVLLLNSDKLEEATQHFDAAIKIDPSYDVALQNAAVAQMRLGDKKKKAAEAAVEGKKNAKVDKSYQEHFKAAVGYFEKLVSQKPDNADIVEYLASAYANAGDYKKAEEMMKKADALRHK